MALSLPSRGRGLKFLEARTSCFHSFVAPLAGAWIEITFEKPFIICLVSLPSRERGLK